MESVISLRRVKSIPTLIWVLLFGAFFTRGSFFMVWPFLSVILYNKFGLSAAEVGLILSSAAGGSALVGLYSGSLSDKFGRKALLYLGCLFSALSFALMAMADEIYQYVIVILMCSASRELWEPSAQALIGDSIDDRKTRELAMQLRYFLINVGAAVGPFVGLWAGLTGEQTTFFITSFAYVALFSSLYWALTTTKVKFHHNGSDTHSFKDTIKVLSGDHVFLMVIVANILMMFVYAHMDSSMVQYLTRSGMPEVVELFSMLILTNALTIIIFQFPLLKLLEHQTINQRMYFGLLLLAISQMWYAFNPMDFYWGWIGATFIMSLGEAILFPSINVQIDQLAPAKLRGSYFGAASLYSVGWASAPFIGGVILDQWSGQGLYLLTFAVTIVVFSLYMVSHRLKRPEWILKEVCNS